MNVSRLIILFTGLLWAVSAGAQVKARASVDRDSILIGEPLVLTIALDIPSGTPAAPLTIDSLPHFEFLQKPVSDTTPTSTGQTIRTRFQLTSFDSGRWAIPAIVIAPQVVTDSIPVSVGYSPFDPNQDYHDVKDVIAVTVKEKREWWYAAAAAVVLTGLIIWLLLRKKKKAPAGIPVPVIDPYREAMAALQKFRDREGDAKTYYSELTDIFRLYISRKKGILSLQKTTDDLVMQLKSLSLEPAAFSKLAQALQLSDFVKFAKYVPAEADDRIVWDTLKTSIDLIEQKG